MDLKRKDFSYFLHVSTLDKQLKNPQGILDALSLLKQKGYEEVRLRIISDEPYGYWQQKAKEMGLESFVNFEGPLTPEELVPHFQQASCFILFSHYESFSIVAGEAWSCGIPVISTPVGIAFDMDSSLGFNVKDNDSLSLAMAMEKILNDAEFNPMTIRKHALQYSDLVIAEELNALYSELNG
jgi:D-inositol-3-phosphate glycosyltransferase